MALSHPSRRAGRTATQVLVVLGVAGTIGASALAYADTHTAAATTGTTTGTGATQDGTSSDPSGSSTGDGAGIAPQLGSGSGTSHARSSGS
jgi:hypothetical protein